MVYRQQAVHNLKPLNKYMEKVSFQQPSVYSVPDILMPGHYVIRLDLKQGIFKLSVAEIIFFCIFIAYYHVSIAAKDRKYLRFVHNGQAYEFQILCYGLHPAPYIFTVFLSNLSFFSFKKDLFLFRDWGGCWSSTVVIWASFCSFT